MEISLQGCFAAIITPFKDDGIIDEEGLRSNILFLLNQGISGIVTCGSTGESSSLSVAEHELVLRIAVEAVASKALVIAGIGANSTTSAIEQAIHAQRCKADGLLCPTPAYNKPTQEGLFLHFKAIAQATQLPFILYNIPGRTAVNLEVETICRLCAIPSIVAIKEATGDLRQISRIHKECGDRIKILSGDDMLTLPILSIGGTGVISVVANILPREMCALVSTYLLGNHLSALEMHEQLLPLWNVLFSETNPIGIKTAMNHLGYPAGPLRLPLTPMHRNNKEKLISVLKTYT